MKISWPTSTPVALAYVDQLVRGNAIQPERVRAVKSALDHADSVRTSGDKASAAAGEQLEALAKQFESDSGAAQGRGDFRRVHRMGLIACMYRAAEWRHKAVELAGHDLLQCLDRASGLIPDR